MLHIIRSSMAVWTRLSGTARVCVVYPEVFHYRVVASGQFFFPRLFSPACCRVLRIGLGLCSRHQPPKLSRNFDASVSHRPCKAILQNIPLRE